MDDLDKLFKELGMKRVAARDGRTGGRIPPPSLVGNEWFANREKRKNFKNLTTMKKTGLLSIASGQIISRASGHLDQYVSEYIKAKYSAGKFMIQISQLDAKEEYGNCLTWLMNAGGLADISNRRRVVSRWPRSLVLPDQDVKADVVIAGIPIRVRLSNAEQPEASKLMEGVVRTLFLEVKVNYRDGLLKLLDENVLTKDEEETGLQVHIWNSGGKYWNSVVQSPRNLDTVILPPEQKKRIIEDLEVFFSSRESYSAVGLPWHRGMLLHGEPGTGKTALAKAIASNWKLGLYVLNLGDMTSDHNLIEAVTNVPENSVLLMEDIDVFSQTKRDGDSEEGASFAGLLNALDGVFTPEGIIKILTSNADIKTFDEALVRDGRIDLIENISLADENQVNEILSMFFTDETPDAKMGSARINPAKIVGAIKRNTKDLSKVIESIEEMAKTETGVP